MKTFFSGAGILLSFSMAAQSLSPSVLALAGGVERTPNGTTLSWTLGESVTETLGTGEIVLTQGFQQPSLVVSTGYEDPAFDYDLSVFPNPVASELVIETNYHQSISYRLVDTWGKKLKEGQMESRELIDLTLLSSGVYALYFQAEGRMIRSELVVKQ
ncbi:MAG: T9SS type A sorting domain-containing protein [Saprospiraceae bacterium]|nr:T9SS type A sorting domain-containing protein [Saprospiraceae bacterium]